MNPDRYRDRMNATIRTYIREEYPEWADPENQRLDPFDLEGCDAAIHLAGENIASGRWTAVRKQRLVGSRLDSTEA